MSAATMTPREYAFFPQPDWLHRLGILMCETTAGERVTLVVDPEYLRTMLSGQQAGADLGGLDMGRAPLLPTAFPGWPDEWPAGSPYRGLLHRMTATLAGGATWTELTAMTISDLGGMA